jgi:hypothetical protein
MNANSFVFGIVGFGFSARLGERRLTIFEEQLLPLVDLRRLQTKFVTKVRNGNLVNRISPDGSQFFLGSESSSRSCHREALLWTIE